MNKKNKTENSYVNLFKLKKIENVDKNITTEKKKGINFENITDWDDINYKGEKQYEHDIIGSSNNMNPSDNFDKNNVEYKIQDNRQDKEYDFNQNIIPIVNNKNDSNEQDRIIKISYNPFTEQQRNIQNIQNTKTHPMPSTKPIQEIQNDDFSVNTSNFTNKMGDYAANQLDRIELSQNNFPLESNGIQTNMINNKILPFNSTDNIGINYKNLHGYEKKYEIIEENVDEEGKLNPSEFNMEQSVSEVRQETISKKAKKRSGSDSDSDDSDFSIDVNQDLNVTSNQLEDMNRELKEINHNVKLTNRKIKKQAQNENKNKSNNNSGKVKLEPIYKNKNENTTKINKDDINDNKAYDGIYYNNGIDVKPKTPNYNIYNNTNPTNKMNSKPITIQTYQNNTNIMHLQPTPYYNPHFNTINQMNFNHLNNPIHIDPYIGVPMQTPYNNHTFNQIQPIYHNTNTIGNPYGYNYGMFPSNMPNFHMSPEYNQQMEYNQNYNPNQRIKTQSLISPDSNDNANSNEINTKKSSKKSVNYKPYSYIDYKIKYDGNKVKLGGLGANIGTKEWEEKYHKKKKMKEYSTTVNTMINITKENTIEKETDKEKIINSKEKSEDENEYVPQFPLSNKKIYKDKYNDNKYLDDSSMNLEQRIFRDLKIANNINDVITYSISPSESIEKDKKPSSSHVYNVMKLKEDKKTQNKKEAFQENKTKIRAKSSVKKGSEYNKKPITNIYTTMHSDKDNKKNRKIESDQVNSEIEIVKNLKSELLRNSRPVSSKVIITSKNDNKIVDDDPYAKNFYNKKVDECDNLETLLQKNKEYHQKVQNIKSLIYKLN